MARRNVGDPRSVTRRTVIMAGAPQYAGVAMAASIVPAVARASTPALETYADAVGQHFEAASEYGRYDLTLASVESLTDGAADVSTHFGLVFTSTPTPPPAGVYRLSAVSCCGVPDAQFFVADSGPRRIRSNRPSSSRITGRRP